MLDSVAELTDDFVGDVVRILGHEKHPDALGTDQADHLFDLVKQGFGWIVKEQVGFVKEKYDAFRSLLNFERVPTS